MPIDLTPPARPVLINRPSTLRGRTTLPLTPVRRGAAFHPAPDAPTWQQRKDLSLARCEAVARASRGGVLFCESAALVQGLWVRRQEPDVWLLTPTAPAVTSEVLASVGGARRRGGGTPGRVVMLRRRRAALSGDDVVAVGDVVVTGPMRTAVDCAFDLPARESITVLDSAMRVLVQPDRRRPREAAGRWSDVRAELLDRVGAQRGRRGAVRARAVAAIASPLSESPGESVLRWQAAAYGLPAPVEQCRVEARSLGRSFFLDLGWPELRIAFEYDGRDKYGTTGTTWEEKERQDAVTAQGWRFHRFTSRHLADQELLERDVLRAFPPAVRLTASRVPALWH